MDFKNFECCKSCERMQKCKAPCDVFLNSKEMQQLDKTVFDNSMRVDHRMENNHAKKARRKFLRLKKIINRDIKVDQQIRYIQNGMKSVGKVIQITNALLVLKGTNYNETINFTDIFTDNIKILG